MNHSSEDSLTPRHLKVITVLDCVPAYADHIGGEPISILTIEHGGDIDHPMMLRMQDMKLLAASVIRSLAYHGCEVAADVEARMAREGVSFGKGVRTPF
ncbi:MAG TPA: hypothetical protein VF669_09430 [Tepidisphaeraceae bacterium]